MSDRVNAWTDSEDAILAEVVLDHISSGATQLQAFEHAGKRLDRSETACGFRWNSVVRKDYATAIRLAKEEGKEARGITKKPKAEVNLGSVVDPDSLGALHVGEGAIILRDGGFDTMHVGTLSVPENRFKPISEVVHYDVRMTPEEILELKHVFLKLSQLGQGVPLVLQNFIRDLNSL